MTKKERHESYSEVFGSPLGRVVLGDLLEKFNMLEPSFVPGDQYQTAFNEGRRAVMLYILACMNYKPGDFPKIAEERINEWRNRQPDHRA